MNIISNPLEDPQLQEYKYFFHKRADLFFNEKNRIDSKYKSLKSYANLHEILGVNKFLGEDNKEYWRFCEYMPKVTDLWLTTDKLKFQRFAKYKFKALKYDDLNMWELIVPASEFEHGTYFELRILNKNESKSIGRVPAFAKWVEQDSKIPEQWCARHWDPAQNYVFKYDAHRKKIDFPLIYEAHIGIAQNVLTRTKDSVGSYTDFKNNIIPHIKDNGYNVIQLMGVLEHPLYKSFGYQVSSYFAVSSRFGSINEFKELVDFAHSLDIAIILDIPHSHSSPNTEQGIAEYDTSSYFFNSKMNQWGTASFDYGNEMTRRFLLSNCRFWLEEFHIDGFRFDAVGNMIYVDHGIDDSFSHVGRCFYTSNGEHRIDDYGSLYLCLANDLIHDMAPHAISIAEEFSGMPGMTSMPTQGGLGFDYRFAMGIPDFWAKYIKDGRGMDSLWCEMTNMREYEKTINYVECHDQCINGKNALIWRIIGNDMHQYMSHFSDSWTTAQGIAQYKLMRLVTLATAKNGYLNFMGNEFGHPEWIDGEDYGHRQWHLLTIPYLKYLNLYNYDKDIINFTKNNISHFQHNPTWRLDHNQDCLLAFERGSLLFVFNFHQTKIQEALSIFVPAGKYTEIFSTDEKIYAGHENLTANTNVEHFSDAQSGDQMQTINVYLPPMTALILKKEN